MEISQNISMLRKKAGYSQAFLAKLLGVDKNTVSAWEKGVQKPQSDNICALTKIFNTSADELLGLIKISVPSYDCEFGLEFRPEFRQEFNLDIQRSALFGLSHFREDRRMSRKDLADALGVTPKTIHNWESKGIPKLKIYQNLFTIFDFDGETFQSLR